MINRIKSYLPIKPDMDVSGGVHSLSKRYGLSDKVEEELCLVANYINHWVFRGYSYDEYNKIIREGYIPYSDEVEDILNYKNIEKTGYKLKNVTLTYENMKGYKKRIYISKRIILLKIRKSIIKEITKVSYPKKHHKPYANALQYWIENLDQYIIFNFNKNTSKYQKNRYFIIGEFLEIANLPLRQLQGKNEGQSISKVKYIRHIRNIYLSKRT